MGVRYLDMFQYGKGFGMLKQELCWKTYPLNQRIRLSEATVLGGHLRYFIFLVSLALGSKTKKQWRVPIVMGSQQFARNPKLHVCLEHFFPSVSDTEP